CKEITTMMGGEVGVFSTQGAGSNFWFTVKLKINSMARLPSIDQEVLKAQKFLVVDDNVTSQNAILEQVESYGALAFAAGNLEQAEKLVAELANTDDKFDAAIVSLNVSNVNSRSIAELLRSRFPDVLLVYISSVPYKGEKKEMEDVGFRGYFTRPL